MIVLTVYMSVPGGCLLGDGRGVRTFLLSMGEGCALALSHLLGEDHTGSPGRRVDLLAISHLLG